MRLWCGWLQRGPLLHGGAVAACCSIGCAIAAASFCGANAATVSASVSASVCRPLSASVGASDAASVCAASCECVCGADSAGAELTFAVSAFAVDAGWGAERGCGLLARLQPELRELRRVLRRCRRVLPRRFQRGERVLRLWVVGLCGVALLHAGGDAATGSAAVCSSSAADSAC